MKKNSTKKLLRRTFYLQPDISAWLQEQANAEERSVSNYVTMILRKAMADSAVSASR